MVRCWAHGRRCWSPSGRMNAGRSRRMRVPVVVDDYTRDRLALVADASISGVRVARKFDCLLVERGKPRTGKPVHAFAESFARLRDEVLNETQFRSAPARARHPRSLARRLQQHPYSRLGWMDPATYAAARRSAALRSADGHSLPGSAST